MAAFALVGCGLIAHHTERLREHRASLHWPSVEGTILQSERVRVSGRGSPSYYAKTAYTYKVNGTTYTSSQISLWTDYLAGVAGDHFLNSHPTNSTVTVHYNPQDPTNAVLLPGADERANRTWMVVGAVILLLAVGIAPILVREQNRIHALLKQSPSEREPISLNLTDVKNAGNAAFTFLFISLVLGMAAVAMLLIPLLSGPPSIAGSRPIEIGDVTGCAVFGIAAIFVFRIALRSNRKASCPACRNQITKLVIEQNQCGECGTRLIFQGKHKRKSSRR